MDHKVFISYSSRDVRLTERIYDRLERDGIKCWMSSRDVPPGADFQACIVAAIGQAELVLLIFSSEANNSNEIAKELSLASKKLLIPTRIEDVLPEGAFKYQLSNRQFVDLFEDFDHRLDQLSKLVQAALDGKPAPVMVPKESKQVRAASSLPRFVIPVAVAAVLAAAGIGWYSAKPSAEVTPMATSVGSGSATLVDSGSMAPVPPASDQADTSPIDDVAQTTSATRAQQATNPSFSCLRATHVTEKLICQSRALADLDRALAASYKRALGEAGSDDGRAAVKRSQYVWLVTQRNSCTDERCLQETYQTRINALAGLAGQLGLDTAATPPSIPLATVIPSARSQQLIQSLADLRSSSRLAALSSLLAQGEFVLTAKDASSVLDGMDSRRERAIELLAIHLAGNLSGSDIALVLGDSRSSSRLGGLRALVTAGKVRVGLTAQEVEPILDGIDSRREQAITLIASLIAQDLGGSDIATLLGDSRSSARLGALRALADAGRFRRGLTGEEVALVTAGLDSRKSQGVAVLAPFLAR